MLAIFLTVFLILGGSRATPIELNHPCEKLRCKHPQPPHSFPEDNEELQKICKPGIEYIECEIRHAQCWDFDPEDLEVGHKFLSVLRDICSEDTLLHAAVVDNLKCFSKLLNDESKYCPVHHGSDDHVERLAEALSEEGIITLSEMNSGNETFTLHECIAMMNFFACSGLTIERECGSVAMDAYIEIVERAAPMGVDGCEDMYHLIPAIIRIRRVEEEKEHEIVEAFRKKK